ncbi:LysR family transcriptional regulator [Ideonella paludis]|uniref:LysR family transcriptional regulator n=1 Tax=Ideonella paludis TaxID=1233411 RepID=A0ABS5DZ57_9BURK|nr:LysR family transcriptional regulator [Ideonella paludis]MBQ0936344.1 LysR family transcriptional regulator [Ideonella paludis]
MDLRQLRTFVQVAEAGSFSKAALILDVAQPALSRQVRQLETELRETLLLRHGRGVALTEAGQRLLAHGRAILQQVEVARSEVAAGRDEPAGQIAIGLPPSLARQWTLPLIQAFQIQMPKARCAIIEGFSMHISEWLSDGRLDLGLLYNPEPSAQVSTRPLIEEALCLVSPVATEVSQDVTGPMRFAQLSGLPLVMPQRGHTFRKLMETQAALHGVQLNVVWEVSSVGVIPDLVSAGLGHAALTAGAVRAHGALQHLRVRPIEAPQIISTLCLAEPAQRRSTPLTRRTAQLLEAMARAG